MTSVPLLAATSAVQHRYPALRVEQAGDLSLNKAVNDRVNQDLSAAAGFSLPITLLILLIAFGAIVAAGAAGAAGAVRGRRRPPGCRRWPRT